MPLIKVIGGGLGAVAEWTTRPPANITTTETDTVSRLVDATGHGRSFTQATEASQPTVATDVARGNSMIKFGSGQHLSAEMPDRQLVDIWVVIDVPSNISGDFVILSRDADTTTTDELLLEGGTDKLLLEGGAGSLLLESGTTKAAFELRLNENSAAATTGDIVLITGADQLLINSTDSFLL